MFSKVDFYQWIDNKNLAAVSWIIEDYDPVDYVDETEPTYIEKINVVSGNVSRLGEISNWNTKGSYIYDGFLYYWNELKLNRFSFATGVDEAFTEI